MKFGTLQVMGADGRQREVPLELPSLVVGRAEGNTLIIDDLSVSRRHARLVIESGRLMVEDLGSAQGTFINGSRIEPGVANLVADEAELRFGDIEARYVPPPAADMGATEGIDEDSLNLATSARLGITLTTPNHPVYAGAPWAATVVVHNRSNVVDRVVVTVPDLPTDWVRINHPELALPPGASQIVQVTLMPPRRAESLAGDYDFTVRVASTVHQREASALGQFTMHPFRNLALSFEAPRRKRDFVVLAENKGNEVATYAISGEDPDAAWRFEFELPAVTLQPGERRTIGLRVKRKTQWMGIATAFPFNVHAESGTAEPEKVTAIGWLAVNPPLQKFRAPALFLVAALVIAGIAVALMLVRNDDVVTKASAESPYAGVHLCDASAKAQADARAKQEAAAAPKPGGGAALTSGPSSGAPYFAQNDPRWGKDEYARAKDPEFGPDWCGSTIEQCGCAMSSVATTMALFGLVTMPDGTALTPQSMNSWFNAEAVKTNRGWVSRGYIYGDVIWTAANQLSGEMAAKNPGAPTIRFARTGNGSDDEIKEQLRQGRPIILEVPGHWIAAVGLDGDTIQINDPFYRDRKSLDVYKGKVKSSVIFEPSSDLSAVVFTAPSDVRVRITDKQGRVVGTLNTGSAEDAEKNAVNQIPGASYSSRQAWRDPSCIESAPPPDAGTNQIILPGGAGDYKVEVLDAAGKPTSIAIHTYDKQGKSTVETIDNPGSAVAQVSVDAEKGRSEVTVIAGAQPTPEPKTPTGGGGGGPDQTAGPAPTSTTAPTPTATPEPLVETGLSISTLPGDTFVAIQSQDGFAIGDTIIFSPGKANEEENRIIGFGSFVLEFPLRFAHSPGEVIRKKPRPPGSSAATDRPLPPPVVLPPLAAPQNLTLGCSAVYVNDPKEATLICTLDIAGTFTTTRWTVNGKAIDEVNNQQLLLMSFNSDGNAAVGVAVCNRTICKSTSFAQKIQFPPVATASGPTGGGTSGGSGLVAPTPTPPATGVIVNCTSQFEQGVLPKAVITCAALFSGPSTSISWSAPGGTPASGQGKTFTTNVQPGGLSRLRVTATVCNFAVCQTSPTVDVGIGSSTTKVFLKSNALTGLQTAPLNSTTTFTAIVSGPVPPAGGTVQFNDGLVAVGPSVPLFTAGAVGFAQTTIVTGSSPLVGENTDHPINAVYSGGTNLFGSFSANSNLRLLPPVVEACNAVDDDSDTGIDNGCDLALPRDIGGGTRVEAVSLSGVVGPNGVVAGQNSSNLVVRPGASVTVNANLTRFPDCPGCIRQVYLGVAPNSVNGSPGVAPVCVFSGGVGTVPPGVGTNPWTFTAPTAPGIYYVRAVSALDFACVQATPLGPHDLSIARIVVDAATTTSLTVASGGLPVTGVDDGTPVTVTVSVSPVPPIPGSVRLNDGGSPAAADQFIGADGKATFTFTPTTAGSHLLKATYSGYPATAVFPQRWYGASTDTGGFEQTFDLSVRTGSTTNLDLTAGGSPVSAIAVGATVTANVTVTPDITFPMLGSPVTLRAGGVLIPTIPAAPTLDANGAVTFTFVAGDTGVANAGTTYQLTTTFGGATYVAASTSGNEPLQVNKANSATTLTLVPNTSIVVGDEITMTATVAGVPFGSPDGGVVTFRTGPGVNDIIGTATVSAPPLALGVAILTFTTGPNPISLGGPYNIYAEFGGTTNLSTSTSASQAITVQKSPATVSTPVFSANPTTVGAAGTITVTISPPSGKTPGGITGLADFYDGVTLLPGGGNVAVVPVGGSSDNATVTYSLALLNAGSYPNVRVHYQGSGKYEAGDSPTAALTVSKATPVVTLAAPGSHPIGTTISLTATLVDNNDILDPQGGDVRFFVGGQPLCGTPLPELCPAVANGGVATLTGVKTGELVGRFSSVGGYTISAQYSGNGNLNLADSNLQVLTLAQATSSVVLTVTPASATIGASITFEASLTAGVSTPIVTDGGTVNFVAGLNTIAANVPVVGGVASISHATGNVITPSPFDTGGTSYTDIKAVYSGNTNVATGQSGPGTLTLSKASTSATLATIANVTLGSPRTFSVTVTGTTPFSVQGPAGGATVQFYKDSVALGSPVTVAGDGSATLDAATGPSTAFTDSGSFVIHAIYNGTSQLTAFTSGNQTFVVDKAPTTTTLVQTGTPFSVGGAGSLVATVSPSGTAVGGVTGTVVFSSTEQGSLGTPAYTTSGDNLVATLNISGLNAGSYTTVTATYSGSTKYDTSASTPPQTVTINKVTPTITLSAPGTHTIGTDVTFTATVGGPASGVLSPVGGTVTFRAGTNTIGTAAVNSDRVASRVFTTGVSPLDTGDFTYSDVTAEFVDDGINLNSATSAAGTLVLNKAAATVTLNNVASVAYGATATYTATVSASNGNATVGNGGATVIFSVGGTQVGSTQTLSGGQASVTFGPGAAPLAATGTYTMTATYSGSSQVASGSGTDLFDVVKATPTVTVTNNGPVTVGSSVTITAAASATASADGGTVTFSVVNPASTLGTSVVGGAISAECGGGTNVSGQAKCVVATGTGTGLPSVGGSPGSPYTVTAAFATTAQVAAGSGTTSITLNKTGPAVTFTAGTGSAALGSSASFVVNVSGNCGGGNTSACPTGGTVSLYIGSLGSSAIQTATVSGNTATFTAIATGVSPFANAAAYSMFAQFNGNATNGNVSVADSGAVTLTLTPVTPTVTITSSATSGGAATTFTLTATVTPNFGPTGTVQFRDSSTSTDLGTLQTLSTGNSVQINGVTLAVGTHVITAVFTNTSANYSGAPTYVTVTITIT